MPPVPLEPGVFLVRYEMALTAAELHRLAVHLPGGDRLEVSPRRVAADLGDGRSWSITLGPERARRIALLSFPITDAEIRLTGFAPAVTDAFLARFHTVFRKGGG